MERQINRREEKGTTLNQHVCYKTGALYDLLGK